MTITDATTQTAPEPTALVINPLSHNVARNGSWLEGMAEDIPGHHMIRLTDFSTLTPQLRQAARAGVTRILIEGGDGTLLAVLSACLDPETGFSEIPEFGILPGGSTNLAYEVLGIAAKTPLELSQRLQKTWQNSDWQRIEQPALMAHRSDMPKPFIGFLLSTGSLARVMLYVQRELHSDGKRGGRSIMTAILHFLLAPFRIKDADNAPVLRASTFKIHQPELNETMDPEHCLAVFTTLPHLSLGLAPFWGTGHGAVKLTRLGWPVHQLRRALLKLLLNKTGSRLRKQNLGKHNLSSHCADVFEISHTDPIMIDGESISPAPDGRLRISATQPLVFLR